MLPVVLSVQTMVPGMGNNTRPFYLTPEAPQYAALASFYGTPVVSMRNALWRSGRPDGKGLISLNAVSPKDGSTPLDAGHSSIADTLVFLTQRTAQDLVLLPYGDYDRQSMSRDVPERGVYSGGCGRRSEPQQSNPHTHISPLDAAQKKHKKTLQGQLSRQAAAHLCCLMCQQVSC